MNLSGIFSKSVFILALATLFASCNSAAQRNSPKKEMSGLESETDVPGTFILTPEGDTIQKVFKSDEEWAAELNDLEYKVLRKAGTERAFTGDLWNNKEKGIYTCRGCSFPLFDSATKFESGTGWPSFYQPLNSYCIEEHDDSSLGMVRTEVLCNRCGGHLGHVFEDGPKPTGLRYCINSVSLDFVAKK